MRNTLIARINNAVIARENCQFRNNPYLSVWEEKLSSYEKMLPSGSGIDSGTKILLEECRPERIVFYVEFHHLDDTGMYTCWTRHKIVVTPAFGDILIKISGPDKNQIKEYLQDTFHYCLTAKDIM